MKKRAHSSGSKFIPGPNEGRAKSREKRRTEKRHEREVAEAPKPPKVKKEKAPQSAKPAYTPPISAEADLEAQFNEIIADEPKPAPNAEGFSELGLDDNLIKALVDLGYEAPTPIQAQAIPLILDGGDIIGQAQTGTGKTAAFALPVIQRIKTDLPQAQALILAPTRELAVQVAGGIHDLAKYTKVKVVPVYGGQPIDRQIGALKGGAQIVVGTPGRVLDHVRRGTLSLEGITHCTLDEADEMLALGFMEDMEQILAGLPEERQLALFSATMPPRIAQLSKTFLRDPGLVTIESKQRTVESIAQSYYEVPRGKKLDVLSRILDMETPGPTIVFCRTRQETMDLSEHLRLRGYAAEPLHGEMGQNERDRAMRRFRDGQSDLLIATDVAARGLDIETVTHVINYNIPWDVEQYIHRIGRTGRAGRAGDAITLVEGKQRRQLEVIEKAIGARIELAKIPTREDITLRRRENFVDSIRESLDQDLGEFFTMVKADLSDIEPIRVAAATLKLLWDEQFTEIPGEGTEEYAQPEKGMVRIFIGMGRQDGLRPGDLVAAIATVAEIPGKTIGVIDILDKVAFVEVPEHAAEDVIQKLGRKKLKNRPVKVSLARPREAGQRRPRG